EAIVAEPEPSALTAPTPAEPAPNASISSIWVSCAPISLFPEGILDAKDAIEPSAQSGGDNPEAQATRGAPLSSDPQTDLPASLQAWLPAVYDYLVPPNPPIKSRATEQAGPPDFAKLIIHWVAPNFGPVSGGMRNIFELIRYLETKGHKNRLYVFGDGPYKTGEDARQAIIENYIKIDAEVFLGIDGMPFPDILVSAGWQTAWPTQYY